MDNNSVIKSYEPPENSEYYEKLKLDKTGRLYQFKKSAVKKYKKKKINTKIPYLYLGCHKIDGKKRHLFSRISHTIDRAIEDYKDPEYIVYVMYSPR